MRNGSRVNLRLGTHTHRQTKLQLPEPCCVDRSCTQRFNNWEPCSTACTHSTAWQHTWMNVLAFTRALHCALFSKSEGRQWWADRLACKCSHLQECIWPRCDVTCPGHARKARPRMPRFTTSAARQVISRVKTHLARQGSMPMPEGVTSAPTVSPTCMSKHTIPAKAVHLFRIVNKKA